MSRDARLLAISGFLRAMTTSLTGVLLGLYLGKLEITGPALGLVISSGLAGAALAAVVATFLGDLVGRTRLLIALTLLSIGGTLAFAFAGTPWALAIAAFIGMVNGMGKDRGAALILEQATLPSTTTDEGRTRTIALYTMLQDLGHGAGAALVGLTTLLERTTPLRDAEPHRALLVGCAALSIVSLGLYAALKTSAPPATARPTLTPQSRGILVKVCALFALDGLGGGFLTAAMLSYFFFERFHASPALVAALFVGARVMNALSHLGAAWLAKRIGLVKTMVFTHLPSSLLLASVAFAPSLEVAAVLFLLREGLVEMDVPTRQSWVMAVVRPEERTLASGLTNLVRLASWAIAPAFAGLLMTGDSLYLPLVIGSAMKIAYDLLLWRAFNAVHAPEERQAASGK